MTIFGRLCLIGVVVVGAALAGSCQEESGVKVAVKEDGSNLCSEFAEVTCQNFFECCVGRELEARLGVEITTDKDACRDDVELECEYYMAEPQHSLELGRISAQHETINACFEQYLVGDEGCFPVVADVWPACDLEKFFQGVQRAGQECLSSLDCVASAYCGADRKCRAKGGKNDPCTSGGDGALAMPCEAAYYCGYDSDINDETSICLALIDAGDECTSDVSCGEGMVCISEEEGEPRVCTSLKNLGAQCDQDDVCNSGLCLAGTCNDGRICDDTHHCSGTCSVSGAECTSDASCGGYCSASDISCRDNSECYYGTCSGTGELCNYEEGCMGTCAVTGYSCYNDSYCDTSDAADVCDAPECNRETCVSSETCEGASPCNDRVCAENFQTLDYCQQNPFGIPFYTGSL